MAQSSEIGDGGCSLRNRLDSIRDISQYSKLRGIQKMIKLQSNFKDSEMGNEMSLTNELEEAQIKLQKQHLKQIKVEKNNKDRVKITNHMIMDDSSLWLKSKLIIDFNKKRL